MSGTRRMQGPGNLRYDRSTFGSHNSLDSDAEFASSVRIQDVDVLPKISVAFLTRNGKVLAVSRGANLSDVNMPGGHVKLGEDSQDAAVRELWEETGLKAESLFPVYSCVKDGYLVTVYKVQSYSGKLSPSPEGMPSWVDPADLRSSSYGGLFQDMMKSLRKIAF